MGVLGGCVFLSVRLQRRQMSVSEGNSDSVTPHAAGEYPVRTGAGACEARVLHGPALGRKGSNSRNKLDCIRGKGVRAPISGGNPVSKAPQIGITCGTASEGGVRGASQWSDYG